MNSSHFDAIIIGAGPAGSMTAYFLAKAGVRVALVDAGVFPRSKPCGGGLQARALLDIPFDVSHILRATMCRMSLSFGLRNIAARAYSQPLVYGVLRTEFDHYLLQRAVDAGACVYEGSSVRSLNVNDGAPISVRVDSGEIHGNCLVGADGANSVVRKLLNTRENYFWQAAVYCEVPDACVNSRVLQQDCMLVDWGTLPSGYAWVFPKNGYVNIGAGGPFSIARHLKRYAMAFLESRSLLKHCFAEEFKFIGHQLPSLTAKTRLAAGRVILVGDAAGLVDPFTGDGISFACQSARIASECIVQALSSSDIDLTEYHARITSQVADQLLWSRKLLSLSVAFPRLIPRLFYHNDRAWETFCKTLRGEGSFQQLKRDILGPFEFAWNGIDWFTQMRERSILNKPPRIRDSENSMNCISATVE